MTKHLWIILAILFAATGAPSALADSYTATFTCTGTCELPLPTAAPLIFPVTSELLETWDGITLAIPTNSADLPTDSFTWANTVTALGSDEDEVVLMITDADTGGSIFPSGGSAGDEIPGNVSFTDTGTFSFTTVATPEPSSVALLIAGVGFLLVLRKLIA